MKYPTKREHGNSRHCTKNKMCMHKNPHCLVLYTKRPVGLAQKEQPHILSQRTGSWNGLISYAGAFPCFYSMGSCFNQAMVSENVRKPNVNRPFIEKEKKRRFFNLFEQRGVGHTFSTTVKLFCSINRTVFSKIFSPSIPVLLRPHFQQPDTL